MTTVLLNGRHLPHQDFEGDDATPGAGGKYVTCTDTSLGRDIAYATDGRKVLDGKVYRAAVTPRDSDGITLQQAKQAAKTVAGIDLVTPQTWHWAEVLKHLSSATKPGLIIQGWYNQIPRMYRFQLAADFGHAMWAVNATAAGITVYDPLDPNTTHHGQTIPAVYVQRFLEELQRRTGAAALFVGYTPLQPLTSPPPLKYKLVIAANTPVVSQANLSGGCIASWTDHRWGATTVSTAPCGQAVSKPGCSSGSASIALVSAGVFAGMWVRIGSTYGTSVVPA